VTVAPARCFTKTAKDRCRVCFTCVRGCPAKAIRINQRQAEIVPERCIGCGNCVRVCSQGAKQPVDTTAELRALLGGQDRVAAMVAPSFAAEFHELLDYRVLVGMLRALGFSLVTEVAFGADLVAARYRTLLAERRPNQQYIATTCPAVVGFVERYWPELVGKLAPIASPMVAMARALHELEGTALKIVFIGPCVAKKVEAVQEELAGDVDVAITFQELRRMFAASEIRADEVEPTDFDPPYPGLGALFPLNRGLLQAASIPEDLTRTDVIATDGGIRNLVDSIKEFASGRVDAGMLELLSCNGCIAGPAMTTDEMPFRRRARVAEHARRQIVLRDRAAWGRTMDRLRGLDLRRRFLPFDQRMAEPSDDETSRILRQMGKEKREDELNCRACGYQTCRNHAVAIYRGLAESQMCLPYVIDRLDTAVRDLSDSHRQLQSTQDQLMHSERLASMGQLAAGVAHELNNPLGVVIMYAHLLVDEMGSDAPLSKDLHMIAEQADRCKRIVSSLLDFARENKLLLQEIALEQLILRSLASVPVPETVEVEVQFGHKRSSCEVDPEQMTQVFTNLLTNAFAAMPGGGQLLIATADEEERISATVRDNGHGISAENLQRIFQPFFTTKRIGRGTGLGLAVVYGIVKMHRGEITVKSNADPERGPTFTEFRVRFPRCQSGVASAWRMV
jgi:two-component system NtrC family sensor kinase